jgi:hypothetical protein
MKSGLLSGVYTNKIRSKKLSVFTAFTEEHLEYVLNILSTLENTAGNYKIENSRYEIDNLKSDIEAETLNYPPEYIFKIAVFIKSLENIYKSANEIKNYIEYAGKYLPIGFDFSEIVVRISSIVKAELDGFFTGDADITLETKIAETERLINQAFKQLNNISGKEKAGNGRIVYYSCIIEEMKAIIRNIAYLFLDKNSRYII